MNILVTGGTGFIGEYFIPQLLEKNHSVRLLVRNIEKARRLFGDSCEYFLADINDKKSLKGCCDGIDIVYHMVAKVGNQLPTEKTMAEFRKVNVEGTRNITEEAKKSGIKKFIFVSSIAAMGIVHETLISEKSKCTPYLPYQISKYEAEQMLNKEFIENNFPVIIIRPTKVYGVGEHEYSYLSLAKLCRKGFFPRVGRGKNYVSNVYVTDLVQALVNLIDNGKFGEIYIITSAQSITFEDSAKIIAMTMGVKIHFIPVPKGLMIFVANVFEKIFNIMRKKPPVTKKNVEATVTDRVYDISKAREDLNYNPEVHMVDGVARVVEWYMKDKIV
ncbi:nucleoside-diphosphate-sugar epimerase [Clostridium tetanomorphum]|uniref:NAD-dependent epimerase/dehydratase family protein n=1 Tax=Clostridium tetanomorphum TaxID=1553 RepID=UPI0004536F44|nr:NAD-dependent epimerase/dehydratase family protein [Clostridium tetanomorphum]KAJ49021.1 sterol-4-alpha-carboxylate 3-dehydrogenase (decarboxylating) [Clostridium tetanomorphum DSM 665]KAJ52114.1 sterol-4-alpha-carboxylate 3-dehydrogenase (decarboxylating) [Clostridium tetanomorphum DSM 665]MBP1863037.1 nucleoside-diphosphate-sugar epimerase [Clostridium tetanomorphum]NRS82866.1 nucleoside-diphosphate-sugar epimerase [Clostridium tetanomorphum]SQC03232.1 protein CapI [Clostridium tetanomorp